MKTESRAFFFFLFSTVLFVLCFRCGWRCGFKFSVTVGRMHCACQDQHLGKCQVGIDWKGEESSVTTLLLDRLLWRAVLVDIKPAGPDIPLTSAWIRSNLTNLRLEFNLCSPRLVVRYNVPSIQQLLTRQISSPWSEHGREAVQVLLLLSLTVPVVLADRCLGWVQVFLAVLKKKEGHKLIILLLLLLGFVFCFFFVIVFLPPTV